MLRNSYPYNEKRFLYNKNTHELHDLLNESKECKINEINSENIIMYDSIEEARLKQRSLFYNEYIDGCFYCLNELHKH